MADESIVRAVTSGKLYGDLPPRARDLISRSAWNKKVSDACAKRRLRWDGLPGLKEACPRESEYYLEVIRISTQRQQVFPYHLADFLSVTPFVYYVRVLKEVLKKDQSYSQVPNFTAADMVRVTGVGRDQYVPLLQACKAKRLLWKVNRESAIRDQLPTEPMDLMAEPWWTLRPVGPVSGSQGGPASSSQEGDLSEGEKGFLQKVSESPQTIDSLSSAEQKAWKALYKKSLVRVDVPIGEDDCIAVPPLEGFVSNKDGTGEDGDPVEKLLYGMFFAASARTTIRELAHVLDAPISEVREAASVACRLGFARRTTQERRVSISQMIQSPDAPGFVTSPSTSEQMADGFGGEASALSERSDAAEESNRPRGIAFVVDTEVTATLMMGSLLKDQRHAVTLFEAGKLSGRLAVRELLDELSRVPSTGEGEIQFLVDQIKSLEFVLKVISTVDSRETEVVSGSKPEIDILRYEVLADLPASTLKRMLSQHYFLVVFMAKTPLPLLKVPVSAEGPVLHGFPSEMAAMPWMQLLMYDKLQSGPVSIAFPKGVQLKSLPRKFSGAEQLLVEFWMEEGERLQAERLILRASTALGVINHALLRSAILVQMIGKDSIGAGKGELVTAEVALPLRGQKEPVTLGPESESLNDLRDHKDVRKLSSLYDFENAIGYLTLLRVGTSPSDGQGVFEADWKVKGIEFGIPLHSLELCEQVCSRCTDSGALAEENLTSFKQAMLRLKGDLESLAQRFCSQSTPDCAEESYLPSVPVLFDGASLSSWTDAVEGGDQDAPPEGSPLRGPLTDAPAPPAPAPAPATPPLIDLLL
ncbi:FAM91A1-like protein [Chloropicon primus]|nr:FAM91A1-like protein [Chloropicon primus]